MGQVFRARDTRLNRDVAIKMVAEDFASSPERLARLTREAQTLAALNHPHIAHIYGIEDSGDSVALIMEPTGEATTLIGNNIISVPTSFHPSGRYLAYVELTKESGFDAKAVELDLDTSGEWRLGRTIDISSTPASELEPTFSPDGRWVAYGSALTGRSEIYLRPFPGLNGTWLVSTEGGAFPTWSKSGNELLYATLDQRIMAVSYAADGSSFRASARSWTASHRTFATPWPACSGIAASPPSPSSRPTCWRDASG